MGHPENPLSLFNRRYFLELTIGAGLTGLDKILQASPFYQMGSPERTIAELTPNERASLVNLSIIPNSSIYQHRDREKLLMAINFNPMYTRKTKNHLNLDFRDGGNLAGYGPGLKEAIGRNQQVFLIIELPGNTDTDVTLEDWKNYVTAITATFKGAHFIIGNEIDAYPNNPFHSPTKYAEFFLKAAEIIRLLSPKSKILLYGEAYEGEGKTLRDVIKALYQISSAPNLPVDGLCFHYYSDIAELLPERAELYSKIAQEFGLPRRPYLTELGKVEAKFHPPEKHCQVLTRNLATALALVSQGKLELAFWHTAYAARDDLYGHSLTWTDPSDRLHFKPAFEQFFKVSQLLHHDVHFSFSKDLSVVKGITSQGGITEISWNSPSEGPIQILYKP